MKILFTPLLCVCVMLGHASASVENMISTNEIEPGKGIVLVPGSELELQCNVTDYPQMTVNWLKNGYPLNVTDDRIDMTAHNTLTIQRTTEGDSGSYMCEVNDENVKANATIVVRTQIKLLPFDHSRNIVEGQNIVLTCNVTQGTPLPTLQWLKDAEPLNLSDPRILAEADRGIDAVKLTIKEAEFDDRAEYMCVATNDLGSVNATILVRVKDKFAALWPFLGICAEVAILITIIFIYEKKRQKPDYDESEADHNTENKTVPDQEDKSQDVRQRK